MQDNFSVQNVRAIDSSLFDAEGVDCKIDFAKSNCSEPKRHVPSIKKIGSSPLEPGDSQSLHQQDELVQEYSDPSSFDSNNIQQQVE